MYNMNNFVDFTKQSHSGFFCSFVFTLEQLLIAKSVRLLNCLTNLASSQIVVGICFVFPDLILSTISIKRTTTNYHYGFSKQSKFYQQKYREKGL